MEIFVLGYFTQLTHHLTTTTQPFWFLILRLWKFIHKAATTFTNHNTIPHRDIRWRGDVDGTSVIYSFSSANLKEQKSDLEKNFMP